MIEGWIFHHCLELSASKRKSFLFIPNNSKGFLQGLLLVFSMDYSNSFPTPSNYLDFIIDGKHLGPCSDVRWSDRRPLFRRSGDCQKVCGWSECRISMRPPGWRLEVGSSTVGACCSHRKGLPTRLCTGCHAPCHAWHTVHTQQCQDRGHHMCPYTHFSLGYDAQGPCLGAQSLSDNLFMAGSPP